MMIFPRKREVPEKVKEGAVPNTLFEHSDNGWVNADLYVEWMKFFIANIPPARPVLLIQDGHGSHVSIDVIELARANNIHLLCLPAHTTHILQPLDVGVFKSFKCFFSKACTINLAQHPGRVITPDILASLVGDVYPQSFTPVNIMSGFRKCGIYPLNPAAVKDRQTNASKVFRSHKPEAETSSDTTSEPSLFTPEQEVLYAKEGYDLLDPAYVAWLKINHPEVALSVHGAGSPSECSSGSTPLLQFLSKSDGTDLTSPPQETATSEVSSAIMSEVLVLPNAKTPKKKRVAVNSKAGWCN